MMKRRFIWGALIATLVAVYFAPPQGDTVVAPVKAVQPPTASSDRSVVLKNEPRPREGAFDLKIRARHTEDDLGNVFASHTWAPPPPPRIVPVAVEPPPPEAPPLPFQFLGRLIEDGKVAYFLQFNDRNLVMRVGDTVDKTYTLEQANGGTLTFAYLPLNKKQTLAVGDVN